MSRTVQAISCARLTSCVTAAAVTAATLVFVSGDADAAQACHIRTSTKLDSSTHFAGGSVLRRYSARAHGSAKGGYDQRGKIVMASYPKGAYPALINMRVGIRKTTGAMVKDQRRRSLAAINGDFFAFPDIGGVSDIEMSRGPMVRDGRVIRGTAQLRRVVGVTKKREPFGGMLAVRGSIRAAGSSRSVRHPLRELAQHQRWWRQHLYIGLERRDSATKGTHRVGAQQPQRHSQGSQPNP